MIKIAVDVGTTNIDMAFFDSTKERVVCEKGFHNRQSLYGSDVINRINTIKRDRSFVAKLKALAWEDIVSAIDDFIKEYDYSYNDIDNVCLSGNTTMISILLEYDISNMGESPYPVLLNKSIKIDSTSVFGEDCKLNCEIIFTGCVSAFIGGDILSGLVYLDKEHSFLDSSAVNLLVDLGTNGEMVLNCRGRLISASSACGPAFEACLKKQGVYGSSALDAVSLLISSGKLYENGCLMDEYLENGVYINDIHITSDIIREILLAKAAISSCIENLFKKAQIDYPDTDKVFISGGFGNYLNIDNAIRLGIIPKAFKNKTIVSGNTSLKGALELLKDSSLVNKMDFLKEKIEVILLADEEGYDESLISNMYFKEF